MYLAEAVVVQGLAGISLPPDFIDQMFAYQVWVIVVGYLTTTAVCAVRFSFLFLFRSLILHVRPLVTFWWVAFMFNVVVSIYGFVIIIAACPKFHTLDVGTSRGSYRLAASF